MLTTPPRTSAWAWFRLLDSFGGERESNEALALRMVAGAYSVKVRIVAASIDNPFTSASWRDFRCGGF
jgi:type VI protein secretion system component VasK